MGDGFKQVGEHVAGCFAATYTDDQTFIVHDGAEYRDALGRNHAHGQRWERFRCNNTACEAVALVRWDTLAQFVTRGIKAGEPHHGD
jgi:hypothetical protein